jgi:hypothetical protein
MKPIALIVGTVAAVALAAPAHAQSVPQMVMDPGAPDQTIVQGAGVKVGEATVLHPSAGAETGFISNVFYEHDNPAAAGVLRILLELQAASLSKQRLAAEAADSSDPNTPAEGDPTRDAGDLEWSAGLRIIGQEYLSGNSAVQSQHDIGWGLNVHGIVFPRQTWQFGFDDDYIRDFRPSNYESPTNINRDINRLALRLIYQPAERALSGAVRYENTIDVFERSTQAFANRIQHTLGVRANWQWLPITRIYADASLGLFSGLGTSSIKQSSLPLRTVIGLQTALTVDTTLNTRIGYGRGFYSSGPDFNNIIFAAQFGWRYSPLGRATAMYSYDFADSIQANYYRDHAFQLAATQQYDRFTASAILDFRLRGYRGIDTMRFNGAATRDDVLFGATLGGRYNFKDWLAATADYELVVDSTSYTYTTDMLTIDPSYVRHQLMAGARATW